MRDFASFKKDRLMYRIPDWLNKRQHEIILMDCKVPKRLKRFISKKIDIWLKRLGY